MRSVVRMLGVVFASALMASGQLGGVRGVVMDGDFDIPLPGVKVVISETGQDALTGDTGSYYLERIPAGSYTLTFSKEGYARVIQSEVVVTPGALSEVEATLQGEYEDMDELVVREINLGGASEIGLLNLRMDSAGLMDSVGADLMSKAGVSDAAQALALVPGTTVQDGKYAVVRGLPDRYVTTQMNGVRLPTADVEKRAVQLDQFPSAMIESVQVSKTFTPNQQGDASGGAVNVVLKGIPDERVLKAKVGIEVNSQVLAAHDEFLTYEGGGVGAFGDDAGNRRPQASGTSWDGAVGVKHGDAPLAYKFDLTAGDTFTFDSGLEVGGLASFFYKRDVESFKGGIDDAYWVEDPGDPVTPQYAQGTPQQGDFLSKLSDVEAGKEELQWGGLASFGAKTENHELSVLYSFTRSAEDSAVLQEGTRGKHYYFPGHDPDDQTSPGHADLDQLAAAPYTRNETLEYIERRTDTLQFRGDHTITTPDWGVGDWFRVLDPKIDWTVASSGSGLKSPDKRLFGSTWVPGYVTPEIVTPWYVIPEATNAPTHGQKKDSANFTIGNLQRIWREVREDSEQYFLNGALPFEQWSGDEGYLKLGLFNDKVTREFKQDSYSNLNENNAAYQGAWRDLWSRYWPSEVHPVSATDIDVNYDGNQNISAWYYMVDLPVWSFMNVVGGARYESTEISIVNHAEKDVTWFPGGVETDLNPGDADVDFNQSDVLPSLGLELRPIERVSLRANYAETVARQTFRELSPIQQQEYLGGDVFIGNPDLKMSNLKNYDLRADFNPYPGGLISVSWFRKDIKNPIEYKQELFGNFIGTTAVNYPDGEMNGFEFELRQSMGRLWEPLEGLSLGGNMTYIKSEATLPEDEKNNLAGVGVYRDTRPMLHAPEYLYNLNATYSIERTGTDFGLFYSVKGDTLIAGAGLSKGKFVPDVYEKERGSLNFTVSQKLGDHLKLAFKAKNLTDPDIQEIYRSEEIGEDVVKKSYTKGIDYSIELGATW